MQKLIESSRLALNDAMSLRTWSSTSLYASASSPFIDNSQTIPPARSISHECHPFYPSHSRTCGCCSKGVMNSNLDSKRGSKLSHALQRNKKRRTLPRPHWERYIKRTIPHPKRRSHSYNIKASIKLWEYTGEFRWQFFPGEDVACVCGENLQTREHILRTCTHYANHLKSLQDENRKIALPELLGTSNEIAVLTTFLQGSGALTFTGEKFTLRNAPSETSRHLKPKQRLRRRRVRLRSVAGRI